MIRRRRCPRAVAAMLALTLASLPETASAQGSPQIRCRAIGTTRPLADVREASGAALGRRAAGVIWTHNDSGEPIIVGIDSAGAVRTRAWVAGAQVVNWEDVAVGPCPTGTCLYIGDIGDNATRRREIVVYRVTEPRPGDQSTGTAEAFRATYPGGARDAEALFVARDGGVFIVSKGERGPIALYRFPMPLRSGVPMRLQRVATLAAGPAPRAGRVTGASISPDDRWIVLRTLTSLSFYRADRLMRGVATRPITVDIRAAREVQGEGVALADDGTVYLVGEGGGPRRPGTFARMKCEMPK